MGGDALHQVHEGLAPLVRGGDVEEDKLVSALAAIFRAQLHRVAHIAYIHEVDAFDGLPVFDVKARYDTFR